MDSFCVWLLRFKGILMSFIYFWWIVVIHLFIFIVVFHCINVEHDASHFSVVHLGCFQHLIIMNKIVMNDIGQSFEGINKISWVDT